MVGEISCPHPHLKISPCSGVKPTFLPNHWTKLYEPGVDREALDNARKMAVESNDSARKRANASGVTIMMVVTLEGDGDARKCGHVNECK